MRRLLRYLLLTILALVALVVLAIGFFATPPGKGVLASIIERAASSSGLAVRVEGLGGFPPFSLSAERISVADSAGVFAEVEQLAIDPKVLRLLTGGIGFDSITAERVAVSRQPNLPAGESSSGSGALIALAAEDISVARMELGAGIVGQPAVLALHGRFISGGNGSITADINAERLDGRRGALIASVNRADGSAPLTATIDLAEGEDGILVGLMGRDAGPGYTLSAAMGANGENIEGDLRLASEGDARFDGRFSAAPISEAGRRLVLSGSGDLAELIPPEYSDLLAGPVELSVDADWRPGNGFPRLVVRRGEVSTRNVQAGAVGAFGEPGRNLDVTINIAREDGGAIVLPGADGNTRLDTLSLAGKVAPAGDVYRLDLTGNIRGFRQGEISVPGIGISMAAEARRETPLNQSVIPFDLRVEADSVDTPAGRVESTREAPLMLTARGSYEVADSSTNARATLHAGGGTLDFTGDVEGSTVTGEATATFSNLATLAPIAGRTLAGSVQATASGTFAAITDLTFSGTARNLDIGEATVARLMQGETTFSGKVQRSRSGALTLDDLSIDNERVAAGGTLRLDGETIEAALEGQIADLAALADASSGTATFRGTISGTTARPNIDATISIPEGRLLDQPVDNAVVTLKGAPGETGWSGALALDGGFAGRPLAGRADASLEGASGLLSVPSVDLSIGDNRITGSLQRTADGLMSGELALDAPNIATLAAFALVEANGSAQARVRFSPEGNQQGVNATFAARGITYGPVTVSSVEGQAQIDDAFGTPMVRGNATASQVNTGGVRLDSAQATATVDGGATRFEASARGPDLNLTGAGSLSAAEGGGQTVLIDRLDGSAFRFPVQLSQPVTIGLGDSTRITNAALAIGGGTIRIDGTVTPRLDVNVVASNVSASVINAFAPDLAAEGSISARATATGETSAPAFQWQVDWAGLRTSQTRTAGLPGMTVTARGEGTQRGTSVTGSLAGAGIQLNVNGQVPFAGAGLDLDVNGAVPLSLIAIGTDREVRLGGAAQVAVAVTGSTSAPQINGTVDLQNATMADTDSGFGVTGVTGRIDFDGSRAVIQQISGRLAQGGTATVSGSVTTSASDLPADLAIRVVDGRYSDGQMINTRFDANLIVRGPLAGAGTVAGEIVLGRTEIQIPDRLGSGASAIDVRHVNAPPSFTPPLPRLRPGSAPPASGGSSNGGLGLNVGITAQSGVFVRGGFGIDAEVGGALRITGNTGNPQAVGGLELSRGRMEALGKRFDFTRGEVTFSGSLTPVIDFAATTPAADAVVTVSVVGPASAPEIRFSASPDLPEEEILSRLLFERGVGALSPLQAVQLVDAVAQMTGAISQGGIFARIRQATGLDDLDIRQSATGGTTVGVGRRINERMRLGVEAGTDAGSGRVVIDLDITDNVKAKAEAGQDGSGKVGVTYEREY